MISPFQLGPLHRSRISFYSNLQVALFRWGPVKLTQSSPGESSPLRSCPMHYFVQLKGTEWGSESHCVTLLICNEVTHLENAIKAL